jgi:MFS family permease
VTAVLVNLSAQAVVFVVDFMENDRHLSATAADLILVVSGAAAIPVLILAGRASDRYGRKPVCCSFLVLSLVGLVLFFVLARGPVELALALAVAYAGAFGAWPTGSAFGVELFPTALRALGSSAANLAMVMGQAAGFVLAAPLIGAVGDLSRAALVLALGPLLAAVLIATSFPETAGAELEAITTAPPPRDQPERRPGRRAQRRPM